MTKLAIIDLDGVVANADARFALAEEAKNEYLDTAVGSKRAWDIVKKEATDLYWRVVFTPENVELDTLIEGAKEALEMLRYTKEYEIMFLTSRPESMRLATDVWLYQHNIQFLTAEGDTALIMKPPAFQYTKTVIWKAGTIQMLVAMYGADDVLVVDDEPANLTELMKYDTFHWRLCSSLAEAIASAPEVTPNDNPF